MTAERHPNCIHPLCGCAGTANCKADPMNTPLPCDIRVGGATFRKGVSLGTFAEAARRWHREAFPAGYELTDEHKAANRARLQGRVAQEVIAEMQRRDEERKAKLATLPPGTCGTCLGEGELGGAESQRYIECLDCDGKGKTTHGVTLA
jgi:hypothetical protein